MLKVYDVNIIFFYMFFKICSKFWIFCCFDVDEVFDVYCVENLFVEVFSDNISVDVFMCSVDGCICVSRFVFDNKNVKWFFVSKFRCICVVVYFCKNFFKCYMVVFEGFVI